MEAERVLGSITAYLLQSFLGFPCGCCFLPSGPSKIIRATDVRMAIAVVGGEDVMGGRAPSVSQERTHQVERRRAGDGR